MAAQPPRRKFPNYASPPGVRRAVSSRFEWHTCQCCRLGVLASACMLQCIILSRQLSRHVRYCNVMLQHRSGTQSQCRPAYSKRLPRSTHHIVSASVRSQCTGATGRRRRRRPSWRRQYSWYALSAGREPQLSLHLAPQLRTRLQPPPQRSPRPSRHPSPPPRRPTRHGPYHGRRRRRRGPCRRWRARAAHRTPARLRRRWWSCLSPWWALKRRRRRRPGRPR